MEEKKPIKISLSTFFLIVAIIIIIVMGIYIYMDKSKTNEKIDKMKSDIMDKQEEVVELEEKISNLENSVVETQIEENKVDETDKEEVSKTESVAKTHEELMEMIYKKNSFKENGISYNKRVNERIRSVLENPNGKDKIENFSVEVDNGKILFFTDNSLMVSGLNKDSISAEVKGISGEVVDIEIFYGLDSEPRKVVFLTRKGEVYILDIGEAITNNEFVAKKEKDISEAIRIEIIDSTPEGAADGSQGIIVTKADGTHVDIYNK